MLPPMRKILVVAAVALVLVAFGVLAMQRAAPGSSAWNARTGEWWVIGPGAAWVPRWSWKVADTGTLAFSVEAATSEGIKVEAVYGFAPEPGRYHLGPGPTPAEGAAAALRSQVESTVSAVTLACIAGLEREGCAQEVEDGMVAAAAQRFGARPDWLTLQLQANRDAVRAARRAALRQRVGRPGRRVLVIGLDGADWGILTPLLRAGVMPNLARLMRTGSHGDLRTITPILSPLIWTTMATGVGPAEHGILDFMEVDAATGAAVPITGRGRKVPALWNMATAAGLSSVTSGWWATWPAESVDGTMISDRLFFLLSDAVGEVPPGTVVFPASAEAPMLAMAGRVEEDTGSEAVRALMPVSEQAYRDAVAAGKGMADPVDGFRRIVVGTRTYFRAALDAMAPDTDLTMVYCIGTDEIGHLLAPYLPPPLPGTDPAFAETARIAVRSYHAAVDRWIGRMVEACPPRECAVLVVSDHGFKWGEDRPRQFSGTAAATAALWHRTLGIWVLAGAGVQGLGRVDEPASVFDVAPTVAALLGLPAGDDWRGTPLPGAPPSAAERVSWSTLVPPDSYRPQVAVAPPSEEYVAQLKALGYLEGGESAGGDGGATAGELNNLGLVHLEAGRTAEAEKAFRDAVARSPAYPSPHYNLRRLYFEEGRYDDADRELLEALRLGLRDGAGALDRAATDYQARGLADRAEALLAAGMERFPDEPRLAAHRLALLVQAGRCDLAAQVGRDARARFPGSAPVHAFAGLAAACVGDAATARAALTRSLELDPDQPMVRQALAALP